MFIRSYPIYDPIRVITPIISHQWLGMGFIHAHTTMVRWCHRTGASCVTIIIVATIIVVINQR